MDTTKLYIAMSFLFGILLIWLGSWTSLLTLPMAKGELKPREVNFRPWNPKFMREMCHEEQDKIGLDGSKLLLVVFVSIIVVGVCSIIYGILGIFSLIFGWFTIFNPVVFLLIAVIGLDLAIIVITLYLYIYKRKIRKACQE